MEKVLGYKKDTWLLFSWCSIVNTDVCNKNKRKLNQKSHFKSHRSTRYCVGLWPCRTPKKTLYESKWNPNHHVWDALKWRASATLYVRLVIIMLRTTITHHGQRLSALPLSNRLRRLGSRFQRRFLLVLKFELVKKVERSQTESWS